jgi:hypothetical protein
MFENSENRAKIKTLKSLSMEQMSSKSEWFEKYAVKLQGTQCHSR